ncbi:MAG: hypothetical protein WKG07_33935 [Hymenobacter sp.]
MRDMIQNHLLQLLCMVAMEPPVSFTADEVRNRKVDVLRAMRRFTPEERARAGRARPVRPPAGWRASRCPATARSPAPTPTSNTETFAAVKFFVDNWRWQGVPFYLRTGKRLHRSASVITIQFKDVPHFIFPPETAETLAAEPTHYQYSARDEHSAAGAGQAPRRGHDAEHRGHGV